ncbi:MAG: hypothetical protein KC468_17340 [Myxococcales bacterium]|nr:hypothetical protein [Myxococcales bacterium]
MRSFLGISVGVMRVDGDGTLLWTKFLEPGIEDLRGGLSAIEARDGGLVVAGQLQEYEPGVSTHDADAWIAELTLDGEISWQQRLDAGEGGHDGLRGLAIAPGGELVLVGSAGVDVEIVADDNDFLYIEQRDALWLMRATAGGAPLWSSVWDELPWSRGSALALHPEHVLVAGTSTPAEEDELRLIYASFSHAGELHWWSGTSAQPPHTAVHDVLVLEDGSPGGAVFLAGSSPDAWVGRFSSAP